MENLSRSGLDLKDMSVEDLEAELEWVPSVQALDQIIDDVEDDHLEKTSTVHPENIENAQAAAIPDIKDDKSDMSDAIVNRSDYSDDLGYDRADYKVAKENDRNTTVRNKNGKNYSMCVSMKKFGKYGVGLYLYFKFLKWFAWGFSFMSILMMFCLASNINSGYLGDESKSFFDKLTAANQWSFDNGSTEPGAKNLIEDTRTDRALLITGDFLYSVFYLVFIFVFRFSARKSIQK
jgi:hypothetical protein